MWIDNTPETACFAKTSTKEVLDSLDYDFKSWKDLENWDCVRAFCSRPFKKIESVANDWRLFCREVERWKK